jgi:heme-degrading monooxygenase HmoA|tara:strand:- start:483 stop:773 length:291 start_codon:yes stop_codon:yes gene_type:complete
MYGTIFNLRVKAGHERDLLETVDDRNAEIKGAVAWFLMRPDDKNADLVGVAVFESKEAYVANANSQEQHEAFTKMMEHLVAEPNWTDGEYVRADIT